MAGQQEPPSPPLPTGSPGSYPSPSGSPPSSSAPPTAPSGSAGGSSGPLDPQRGARFLSMGYESIAKLRAEATKYENLAGKERHRAAKLTTSMEKHRHRATVYREREQATLAKLPDQEANMNELQKMLQSGASGTASGAVTAKEQSKMHVKIRKIQQKMASLQRKAKSLEHAAANQMQIASHKKVLADMHLEKAKQWEAEARAYTTMADRMQSATEPGSLTPGLGH